MSSGEPPQGVTANDGDPDGIGFWFVGVWFVGVWFVGVWFVGVWFVGVWFVGVWFVGVWFVGVWFVGVWFVDVWFVDVWFVDVWFVDVWFVDVWFVDVWFVDVWFVDVWFVDVWFVDVWFVDVWFVDVWFVDVWFVDVWFVSDIGSLTCAVTGDDSEIANAEIAMTARIMKGLGNRGIVMLLPPCGIAESGFRLIGDELSSVGWHRLRGWRSLGRCRDSRREFVCRELQCGRDRGDCARRGIAILRCWSVDRAKDRRRIHR